MSENNGPQRHAQCVARIEQQVRTDLREAQRELSEAKNTRQEERASKTTSMLALALGLILEFRRDPHRELHALLTESGLADLRGYQGMLEQLGREDEALFGQCDSTTIATIWVAAALREGQGRHNATLHQMREDWRQFVRWWKKQKPLPKDGTVLETLNDRAAPRRTDNIQVEGFLRRGWAGCAYSPAEGKRAAVNALMERKQGFASIRNGTYPGSARNLKADDHTGETEQQDKVRRELREAIARIDGRTAMRSEDVAMTGRAAIRAIDGACREAVAKLGRHDGTLRTQLSLAKAIADGARHGHSVLQTGVEILQHGWDNPEAPTVILADAITATTWAIEQGVNLAARAASERMTAENRERPRGE